MGKFILSCRDLVYCTAVLFLFNPAGGDSYLELRPRSNRLPEHRGVT